MTDSHRIARLAGLPAPPSQRFRRLTMPLALLAAALVLVSTSSAADWPTYLRDNNRAGWTPERIATPLQPRWVYSSPAAPQKAWSGPNGRTIEGHDLRHRVRFDDAVHVAVVGDRVFFGSSVDHQLHCLSAPSGEQLWSFFAGGPIRLAPTVHEGRVLFGADDGYAYCLDAEDGRLIWKLRAGPSDSWLLARGQMISRWPVRTGVLVDDGIAYFGAGIFPHENIYLCAARAGDGELIWRRDNVSEKDAERNDLSPQGYLLAGKHAVYVPSGRSLPAAIDKQTGQILHRISNANKRNVGVTSGGTTSLLADGQLFAAGPHSIFAMDQKTGAVGYGWLNGRRMAVAEGAAYLASGKEVVGLDLSVYAVASRRRRALETEIAALRRKLRSPNDDAEQHKARIAAAGHQIKALADEGMRWRTAAPLDSAIIVAGDLVLAGGENRVTVFDSESGTKVWSTAVEGEARGLAVAGGNLYVSTTTGKIYCFADSGASIDAVAKRPDKPSDSPYPKDQWSQTYTSAAEQILKTTGVSRGFALVMDSQQGRLAYELAKLSELKVFCIEPDEKKVAASRRALSAAGVYGDRVVVHHGGPSSIPYSNYFANLVVSDGLLRTGRLLASPTDVARHVKPLGGVICLGRPRGAPGEAVEADLLIRWLEGAQLEGGKSVKTDGPWAMLARGALPGAGSWSHQYGEPGNTASSADHRVKGGLGVLWYGDPGPGKMVNRHEGAASPLAVAGRMFVQGTDSVMGYDAYNGVFLWEWENSPSVRTGLFQNQNPGNMAASNDRVFVLVKEKCIELDAATGQVKAEHLLPESRDGQTHEWGYVAYRDGILFGTSTQRKRIAEKLRRRGRQTEDTTDEIFAIDTNTGGHLWSYKSKSIAHHTIALGSGRVFLIDSSITSQQRTDILRRDKAKLKKLTGEAAKRAEERLKRQDLRLAVALDAFSGETLWAKPVDVTDCSDVGTGGGKLTLMHKSGVLVLCGANANGHYWRQFLAGEFSRRRLVVLSADDGRKLWAKDANYRHRPIIIEDRLIAEPWAFDLRTGQQQMRAHPLTGQKVPWSLLRSGHHCGMLTGSPNMLMFRSGYTGFYDLRTDSGTQHFSGHRLGCWINAIPANGLVMIPEASAGCICLFSITSTVVMEPREPRELWTLFSAVGPTTPVKHMALNLGAPGDRRDARGNVWLGYPRPQPHNLYGSVMQTGLDLPLDLKEMLLKDGGYVSRGAASSQFGDRETPWVFASGARGLTHVSLPLRGEDDAPATYKVKLFFTVPPDGASAATPVDVKMQGKPVLSGLDVAALGGGQRGLVREVDQVEVAGNLEIDLTAHAKEPSAARMPTLCGIQVVQIGSAP